ncbi:peptidylprolyl isomerase [Helicobacter monodelphidis]|uniref:FKBP-type peptidyl-prolyl cis-trans isomerase n=1 Tax=Helicobacter sp. 15-1451 TaxID=2004995 RepID=UPI000DCC9AD1|nr:peptidylprolyl isomerase [Helicobacter sp. 15-1451]RAX58189.1 peptidylprolyl isomerase [Helicobacter sp. 15-1451]
MTKKVFKIAYEVRERESLQLLDSNIGKHPLEFIAGNNEVLEGLEEALLNAKAGDRIETIVSPEKGYGERKEEAIEELPIGQFDGITLERGMTLFGEGENGEHVQVIVQDFNDSTVIVDYNHPLAGKQLIFNVEVLGIRDATENEILYGVGYNQAHGGGGCCGGGGGGCCGGGHHH